MLLSRELPCFTSQVPPAGLLSPCASVFRANTEQLHSFCCSHSCLLDAAQLSPCETHPMTETTSIQGSGLIAGRCLAQIPSSYIPCSKASAWLTYPSAQPRTQSACRTPSQKQLWRRTRDNYRTTLRTVFVNPRTGCRNRQGDRWAKYEGSTNMANHQAHCTDCTFNYSFRDRY